MHNDVAFIALTIVFFVLAGLLVVACDHIIGPDPVEELRTSHGEEPVGGMSYDNALGLFLAVVLTAYLVYALVVPGEAVMTTAGWIQLLVFLGLIVAVTPLLGGYMAKVWRGGKAPGDRVFAPIERGIYRLCGIDPESEQRWTSYTFSLLAFSAVSLLFVYGFERLQSHLPFNPDHLAAVHPDLAWNTAASFVTNTNWQSYGGESTMSHLTQMAGLTVQNFASAAAGLAVMVALIRGLTRRRKNTIGNFWVDLVRTTLRILLPLAFVFAIVLASQGVIQNFHASTHVTTIAGGTQTIPGGPVASQLSIKQLGTNGGGFFNTNSAHPFESPNGLTNMIEMFFTVMIAFAATYALGVLIKEQEVRLGDLRSDVHAADHLDRRRGRVRDRRQPAAQQGRRYPDRSLPRRRAATWRARRSASGPRPPASGRPRRLVRRTAR